MTAEDLGKRLLAEVEEVGLDEASSSTLTRQLPVVLTRDKGSQQPSVGQPFRHLVLRPSRSRQYCPNSRRHQSGSH